MNELKMPIRANPFAHQQSAFAAALEMFERGTSRGYAYLFEMGLGKSITSVATAGWLYLNGKIQRVLIVAPLSIVGVWREEFEKFADFDYTLAVLEGTTAKKADTLRHLTGTPLQVVVVNYESAWRLEAEILKWKPNLVIADESHKIKTHNTNASKTMHRNGAGKRTKTRGHSAVYR